jgi:GntR family transcriptional regulator, arabinose operon transcriptional repressor
VIITNLYPIKTPVNRFSIARCPQKLYDQVVSTFPPAVAKYQQILENLKDRIISGSYEPGTRLPSESELVKTFGVSRITVNRALRELQFTGLIERRAGSGSYVRAIVPQSYTFGLLIPELGQTEIFEPICRGMAQTQQAQHHSLLWGKSLDDSEDKESQVGDLWRQLIGKRVSGVFFAPLELTPGKDAVNRSIVEAFDRSGIPVVLLDRDLVAYPERSRYDLVGIDNRRAGHAITAHLLHSGCRRVIFVGRPRSAPTVDARIAGYREALLDSGMEFRPEFVNRIQPWDVDGIRHVVEHARPDGVVCANDFTAAHLMKTFNELGIIVPDQVRMVGIDDVKYASLLPVPLTTIHQPCAEMGATAIGVMVQRLQNPEYPARDILLDFRLVVRKSCGAKNANSENPLLAPEI